MDYEAVFATIGFAFVFVFGALGIATVYQFGRIGLDYIRESYHDNKTVDNLLTSARKETDRG